MQASNKPDGIEPVSPEQPLNVARNPFVLTNVQLSNKPDGIEPVSPKQPLNVERNPSALTNVQASNKPEGIAVNPVQLENVVLNEVKSGNPLIGERISVSLAGRGLNLNLVHPPDNVNV